MRSVSKGEDPIKRGKDSWMLRLSVVDDFGEASRPSKTVRCRTKTEAKRLLEAWRMELLATKSPVSKREITLEEYLHEYMTYLHDVKHSSPNTLRGYRDIVDTRWVPKLGATRLRDLKAYMVEDQLAWMRKQGGRNGGPLSGNTCQKAFSFLKTALKRAARLEYIDGNPCDLLDAPSRERREIEVLDEEEVARMKVMLMGHPDYRFAAATWLAVDTGMRRGEICGLLWEDVDLDGKRLHVCHALAEARESDTYNGQTIQEKIPKSDRSNRVVSLDDTTVKMLRRHMETQHYRLLYNGVDQTARTPVFCGDLGEPYRPSKLTSDFVRFAQQQRFSVTFHGLRHTHASILLKHGVQIQYVSQRLGHESIEVTYRFYAHFLPGDDGGSTDAWLQATSPKEGLFKEPVFAA